MNKDKYLSTIVPLLKEEGLALSMEAIAQKIGVTKKTLYNRFSSKDQLIEDALEMVFGQFEEDLQCMDDKNISVQERFAQGVTVLRLYFKDMSHAFMRDLMQMYPQKASQNHTTGINHFEKKVEGNIREGIAEGIYRPEIDPALFAKYISFSIFSFFQREVMMANTYSANYYFEQAINFNINALLIKKQ